MAFETLSGRVLDDSEMDALADDVANADYDMETLKARRRGGRPAMGSGPADVVTVRLDPDLRSELDARAERDHSSVSEVIRAALRAFVDAA